MIESGLVRLACNAALKPFLDLNATCPEVTSDDAQQTPTALSWFKKNSPQGVTVGAIYRAFRERQVRAFNGEKVKRVSKTCSLQPGDILLYPKDLQTSPSSSLPSSAFKRSPSDAAKGFATSGLANQHSNNTLTDGNMIKDKKSSRRSSEAAQRATYEIMAGQPGGLVDAKQLQARDLRNWILATHRDVIFVNKPAGVPTQGSGASVASLMRSSLRLGPEDQPTLVHRLDRNGSGVMAIARNRKASDWLCTCFRERPDQYEEPRETTPEEVRDLEDRGMGVTRVYWALLAGTVEGPKTGRIRYPVVVDGRFRQAVTEYNVRNTSPLGLTLVKLKPITGRRHQLRVHCARVLGAPIIGDVRYGYKGLQASAKLSSRIPDAWWSVFSPQTYPEVLNPLTAQNRRQVAAARLEISQAKAAIEKLRGALKRAEKSGSELQQHSSGNKRSAVSESSATNSEPAFDSDVEYATEGIVVPETAVQHYQDQIERSRQRLRQIPGLNRPEPEYGMPIFLHSRRMVMKAGKRSEAVRVQAPLPRYMADVVIAMGWELPPDSKPR